MFQLKRRGGRHVQRAGEKEPVGGRQVPAWSRDARERCALHRGEEWRRDAAGRGESWTRYDPREGRAGWHGHRGGRVRDSGSVRSMAVVQEGVERARGRGGGDEGASMSHVEGPESEGCDEQ